MTSLLAHPSNLIYYTSSVRNTASTNVNPSTPPFARMSLPYTRPQAFEHHSPPYTHNCYENEIDPCPADAWATAIVYMSLITGILLWRSARPRRENGRYWKYLRSRREEDGYAPIEKLGQRPRNAIYAMLHPNPWKRITSINLLRSGWMSGMVESL